MEPQTRKNPILLIVALLALVALASSACSFSGIRLDTSSPVIEITVRQGEFDRLSLKKDFHTDDPFEHLLDEITRVEMHDGFIRYQGTKQQSDGSEVDGSFDMSLGAEDDMLKAEIVAVNIPGLDLSDRHVVAANRELEYELTHLVTDSHGDVLFKEVVVKEGVLRMKIQVNINHSSDPSIRIRFD